MTAGPVALAHPRIPHPRALFDSRVDLEPRRERLVAARDAGAGTDDALHELLFERGPALRPAVGDRDEHVAEDLLDAHAVPLDETRERRRGEAVAVGEA